LGLTRDAYGIIYQRLPHKEVIYLELGQGLLEILLIPCDDGHVSTSLRKKKS
jgi:hypothetical protein